VSSDIVGPLERAPEREEIERRSLRAFAIESLGPVTILGGIVWAIFQPYRIVFFDHADKGFYDYLVQPPLLVIGVGLLFALVIAPGLLDDLRSASAADGSVWAEAPFDCTPETPDLIERLVVGEGHQRHIAGGVAVEHVMEQDRRGAARLGNDRPAERGTGAQAA